MDAHGKAHVQDDPSQTPQWLQSMAVELANFPTLSTDWSICRVSSKLRAVKPDAYVPHIISIGPLHHGTEKLMNMERYKIMYMLSFMDRTGDPTSTLYQCGKTIQRIVNEVRACYAEPITYDESQLARMLLLDGCFMLELFLRYFVGGNSFPNDPIFSTCWMVSTLKRDLALLENQIPFVVLVLLFNFIVRSNAIGLGPTTTLPAIALRFFRSSLSINGQTLAQVITGQSVKHLLHLIHTCYSPSCERIIPEKKGSFDPIASATALNEAGIQLKKRATAKNLLDLKFENGVLKIPQLVIHDSTDSLFRNLIAFEQCFRNGPHYVTSYILLMCRLVGTTRDVELLGHKGIIKNNLGGYDDLSEFFNNICKQVVLPDFFFAGLCHRVNVYYQTRWHRYCAALRRDYFRNPWTIISFVAAIVLLTLTAIQTLYAALSYY